GAFPPEARTMKSTRILLGVALAAVAGFAIVRSASSDAADEAAIKARSPDFAATWNRHDPKALAAFWAEDGDLINPWGRLATGRAEIEKLFQDEQGPAGMLRATTFDVKSDTVRFVSPDVAVDDWETVITGAFNPDGTKA